jgi:predicted phage replisome organizer
MAAVKWVKITTDMFDNRKIKHLRKLPDGNNIVLIWVMLLTMAGRCNAGGMIFLTENIPYTPKMLADELGFEENTVKLAITALEQLNMVCTDNGFFSIAGWNEYQNIEGMEKIREQTRQRVTAHRQKQKALAATVQSNVTCNVTVTQSNATEEDIDIDKEKEKEYRDMGASAPNPSPSHKPKKPVKHKYGEYANVLLTDDELEKLKEAFSDWEERIERLSGYIASTGKAYKSHYATIRNWARKDAQAQPVTRRAEGASYSRKPTKAEELNDFYGMAANWAAEGGENG